MFEFLKQLTDPQSIIHYGGLALLLFVIFAETGLMIGFFLPGDSLVFISGMICVSHPQLLGVELYKLIGLLTCAAFVGNLFGYWFGNKIGPLLYQKKDSFFFKKKYLEITDDFYKKHGGKALIMGRFLPIVRTFAPILAGIIRIDLKLFLIYNAVGAVLWIGALASIGYYLGTYTWVQANIGIIVLGMIAITTMPLLLAYYKKKE